MAGGSSFNCSSLKVVNHHLFFSLKGEMLLDDTKIPTFLQLSSKFMLFMLILSHSWRFCNFFFFTFTYEPFLADSLILEGVDVSGYPVFKNAEV